MESFCWRRAQGCWNLMQFCYLLTLKFLAWCNCNPCCLQGAIAEAGGIKALVDLIFKWPFCNDGVLVCVCVFRLCFCFPISFCNICGVNCEYMHAPCQERAAGALANLAADDKCSMEVAMAGAVHALVMLVRHCNFEGVQEQVILAQFFMLIC